MTQTPQFNNFTTQPLNPLAQQPSQEQFALETEFEDILGISTIQSASRFPK